MSNESQDLPPRGSGFRFSLRTLILLVTCVAVILAIGYWIPRSREFYEMRGFVGYYRGFGWYETPGYFGTNWYRGVVKDNTGHYEIDLTGGERCSFRSYYHNGVLRDEGICQMEYSGSRPLLFVEDVIDGRYYDPKGNLVSEVIAGTGKRIRFYTIDQKADETDFVDGRIVRNQRWHGNGQLESDWNPSTWEFPAEFVGFYENGRVKYRVKLDPDGNPTGEVENYKDGGAPVEKDRIVQEE